MTERAASLLHLVLASLGVTFLVVLILLALPGPVYDDKADPNTELARADAAQAESFALRDGILGWAGAGIAIGGAVGGCVSALILFRRTSKDLEEGR